MNSAEETGFDGCVLVWCEGAFRTTNGKTAHGLVRFTRRYRVLAVIDSSCAGQDAGTVLDGVHRDIPIVASLDEGFALAEKKQSVVSRLVVGLAPDGGMADESLLKAVEEALERRLSVDSGLHSHFSEMPGMKRLAESNGCQIRDIRRSPDLSELHFFSGRIEEVKSFRFAILGTDSAIGKRTSAWMLVWALERAGLSSELIGTGQTAWLQGARYGVLLDALINDYVAGEIEHAICQAWQDLRADTMVIEGQGSLLNPAYPGGFEILAAGRPQAVILQHAPMRREYDGFPGYVLHPLDRQIAAVEAVFGQKPVAVTLNQEGMDAHEIESVCRTIETSFGLPCYAPLIHGFDPLVSRMKRIIETHMNNHV